MSKRTIIAAVIVSLIALSPLSLPLTAKASTIDPNSDEDHDGLSYRVEVETYHSNPDKWDTDGDGWADGWEVWHGYSPIKVGEAKLDKYDGDHDGLTDEQERNIYHSDPKKSDTDGDGYDDGIEVRHDYSPIVAGSAKLRDVDTDGEGLNDAQEIAYGTDLLSADTDRDGWNDHAEVYNGYDPLSHTNTKTDKYLRIAWAK